MLSDLIHWLSYRSWNEVLLLLVGLMLLDGPRYCLATTCMCLYDWVADTLNPKRGQEEYDHCPSVCVVIAGLNESEVVAATIESVVGTYPRLEVLVIDDGSTDGMSAAARPYMLAHPEIVRVITRPWRGGKSSALNISLSHTKAEVLVAVDADSQLEPNSLWEIVQPFKDETIGVVSATVCVRNAFTNLCTWFQAVEYLQSIFIGRKAAAMLQVLPIASGAFAAYRRELSERLRGWDVGPGEDLDMVIRIRKLGYRIAFAQYAICHTEVPTKWKALFKQRRRWEGDGPVRHILRKHNDIANPLHKNFMLTNFFTFLDNVTFNLLCGYGMVAWLVYMVMQPSGLGMEPYTWLTIYAATVAAEILPLVALMYYSPNRKRDGILALAIPLMPIYRLGLLILRIYANTCEIVYRKSFYEAHVPTHVANVTWRW
ncbi:MAG: glycosyltransferase [Planctomycetota bacterium]|nr:glycosyltransferase [Planctomycetota bacterium]MDA1248071.1 glycosyltransferase [Planctomycetota bacterium]